MADQIDNGIALLIAAMCAYASALIVRKQAKLIGLVDIPNSRSSHSTPIPRGGGLGIVAGTIAGTVTQLFFDKEFQFSHVALLIPFIAVATIGFIDDRVGLNKTSRLVVQLLSAVVWILYARKTGILSVSEFDWISVPVGIFIVVAATNVFNFMDGIDGLAASQSTFMCIAGASLIILFGNPASSLVMMLVIVGVSSLAFLLLNWPPARIFMGDVGSASLGFILAAIAVVSEATAGISIWVWGMLGALFVVDGSITLATRFISGQPWSEPHRLHAYQKLTRRWGSHRAVTMSALGVNFLWLLPLAAGAARWPRYELLLLIIAMLPIVVVCIACRAGKAE